MTLFDFAVRNARKEFGMPSHTYMIRHRSSGRYVEGRPYDGAWTWLAPWATYATVFLTKAAAEAVAALMEEEEPGCTELLELDERGELVRASSVVPVQDVA